jgi:hypothetical protein
MANNNSDLTINFTPLIIITFIIIVLIFFGSAWNQERTQSKLYRIKEHTETIYKAHETEFIEAVKSEEKDGNGNFIERVNLPEQGIYIVSILVKDDSGNYYQRNSYNKQPIDTEDSARLSSFLADDISVSTDQQIFINSQTGRDKLFAFTPIKENGITLGYVMVSVRKDQDL